LSAVPQPRHNTGAGDLVTKPGTGHRIADFRAAWLIERWHLSILQIGSFVDIGQ
jgi:hypothetical protein